jgi:hypothetical protein
MDYILKENGDLEFDENGDFLLETDPVEQLRQRVRIAVLTQFGETTIKDVDVGFDWIGILSLPKDRIIPTLIPQLTIYLSKITGVTSVKDVSAEVLPAERTLKIRATINGVIELAEIL